MKQARVAEDEAPEVSCGRTNSGHPGDVQFAEQMESLYAEDERLHDMSLPRLLARVLEYYLWQAEELASEEEEDEEEEDAEEPEKQGVENRSERREHRRTNFPEPLGTMAMRSATQ